VLKVPKRLWESSNYMCAQRLAAMLKELLPVLVGAGELYCNPSTYQKLLSISGASIDRLSKPSKDALRLHGRSHTKPTRLLKSQIPIRTWSELPVNEAGHYQADLVGHDEGNARGEYAGLHRVIFPAGVSPRLCPPERTGGSAPPWRTSTIWLRCP
jgi:hypothetical protein